METGGTATSHVPANLKAEAQRGDHFAAAVRATRMPMIITDPAQYDNPIVFVNDAFLKLTGYTRLEVIGRNCRFLQGPDTDPVAVDRLREASGRRTTSGSTSSTTARTARPSRTPSMSGRCGMRRAEVVYFFASQFDVSEHYALKAEIARLKRALAEAEAKLAAR